MSIFIIFWASVFCLLFFILRIIFSSIASAFNALILSLARIVINGGAALLSVILLLSLYGIVDSIMGKGLGETIAMVLLFIGELVLCFAIVGGLGALIVGAIVTVFEIILNFISVILEWMADICEKGFDKSLSAIRKYISKC